MFYSILYLYLKFNRMLRYVQHTATHTHTHTQESKKFFFFFSYLTQLADTFNLIVVEPVPFMGLSLKNPRRQIKEVLQFDDQITITTKNSNRAKKKSRSVLETSR